MNDGEGEWKWDTLITVGGSVNWCSPYDNQCYAPQKAQNHAAAQLSSNTLRHTLKGLHTPQWTFLYFHVGIDEQ